MSKYLPRLRLTRFDQPCEPHEVWPGRLGLHFNLATSRRRDSGARIFDLGYDVDGPKVFRHRNLRLTLPKPERSA